MIMPYDYNRENNNDLVYFKQHSIIVMEKRKFMVVFLVIFNLP